MPGPPRGVLAYHSPGDGAGRQAPVGSVLRTHTLFQGDVQQIPNERRSPGLPELNARPDPPLPGAPPLPWASSTCDGEAAPAFGSVSNIHYAVPKTLRSEQVEQSAAPAHSPVPGEGGGGTSPAAGGRCL